jgi:hypothetical protein
MSNFYSLVGVWLYQVKITSLQSWASVISVYFHTLSVLARPFLPLEIPPLSSHPIHLWFGFVSLYCSEISKFHYSGEVKSLSIISVHTIFHL